MRAFLSVVFLALLVLCSLGCANKLRVDVPPGWTVVEQASWPHATIVSMSKFDVDRGTYGLNVFCEKTDFSLKRIFRPPYLGPRVIEKRDGHDFTAERYEYMGGVYTAEGFAEMMIVVHEQARTIGDNSKMIRVQGEWPKERDAELAADFNTIFASAICY